jgi:hypothetical protein
MESPERKSGTVHLREQLFSYPSELAVNYIYMALDGVTPLYRHRTHERFGLGQLSSSTQNHVVDKDCEWLVSRS